MKLTTLFTIGAALLIGPGMTQAMPILFDLEEQPNTGDTGFFTSLTMTKMGLSMTITRPSDRPETSVFDIVDFSGLGGRPATWGARTLEPSGFYDTDDTNFFVVDFSAPITSFSAEFGDGFGDDDSPVTMEAWAGFGGSGTNIDSASESYLSSDGITIDPPASTPGTISVSGSGINSVTFKSAGEFRPNTLFWDNFRATPVPDSSTTVILFGLSLLTLGLVKRKSGRKR